ncbi:Probable RNA-directed DNA polymerase from transposon BS [Eumeta japonica]|uniref:Probable RNA-directed DNA polymerase from transposon BS n=1 Tax=Eumeta variegata TaxID=151549 RepID=A0A4C1T8Y1_EUMVA|nr:Probable RNA-directed DNA polymerase from transposon BS [Eumeta japonica]
MPLSGGPERLPSALGSPIVMRAADVYVTWAGPLKDYRDYTAEFYFRNASCTMHFGSFGERISCGVVVHPPAHMSRIHFNWGYVAMHFMRWLSFAGLSHPSFYGCRYGTEDLMSLHARASSLWGYDPDGSGGGPLSGGPLHCDVPEEFIGALVSDVEHPASNALDEFLYGFDAEVASDYVIYDITSRSHLRWLARSWGFHPLSCGCSFLSEKGFTVPSEQLAQLAKPINPAASRQQKTIQSEGDSTAESSENPREVSPAPSLSRGKRKATAALSDDSNSKSTLRGSDEEEENEPSTSFTKVIRKGQKKANKNHRHPSQADNTSLGSDMEVDIKKQTNSTDNAIVGSQEAKVVPRTKAQVTGFKAVAPPKEKRPPPIFLMDKVKWSFIKFKNKTWIYISALNIKSSIKITMIDLHQFREANKLLIDKKIPFYTYALEKERKVKAVVRGIPVEIESDEIEADLISQGFHLTIETLHRLSSDHLPVLLRLGPFTGENHTSKFKKITDWKRVSTTLEEVDTPTLNAIPNDIVSNKDIDTAIGALTNHIGTVVANCQRKVPVKSKRRSLPADVWELIRVKNAALRRASAYPISEYRSRARAFQREVKKRVREFRNNQWTTKIEEEVKQKTTLPPKDDLSPVSLDEVQKHIRKLKTRKAPGLDGISKGLIINEKFGFRPIHSCPQQALHLVEHVSEGFKRKRKTVAIFLDIATAFDKVWHAGLMYKLYQLEVPDRLVLLVQDYLKNRYFTFRHENSFSSKRLVRAGVPQGSTLSPRLYSSYTNDVPRSQTGVQLALFADDTALYLRGINFKNITPRLQTAIDELTPWFQTWKIENPPKNLTLSGPKPVRFPRFPAPQTEGPVYTVALT